MRLSRAMLIWLVLVMMVVSLSGTAWAQSRSEVGGDGECDGDDCETEGGGKGEDERTLGTFMFVADGMPEILAGLEESLEDVMDYVDNCPGCSNSEAGPGLSRTFDPEIMATMCLRESGSGDALNMVGVSSERAGLVAKIRKVTQVPAGGSIGIVLKSSVSSGPLGSSMIYVTTQSGQSLESVNDAIEDTLENIGFTLVSGTSDYFVITGTPPTESPDDLNQVKFVSLDSAITIGEVALDTNTADATDCPPLQ